VSNTNFAGFQRMTISGSGNVGIGSATPGTTLEVAGTIRAVLSASAPFGTYLIPTGGAANSFRFGFGNNLYFDGTNWHTKGDGVNNAGSGLLTDIGTGQMAIFTLPATGGSDQVISNTAFNAFQKMVITAAGSVGIGTTAPGQTLDVAGNINSSGTVTASSFSGSGTGLTGIAQLGVLNTFTATPSGTGVSQGSLYVNPTTASTGQTLLGLAVGGTQKFVVDSSGDVTTAGTINLPTTTSSTVGVLNLGGSPFLHSFGTQNTFLGKGAGNFTMSGQANTALGYIALNADTSGLQNTAMGTQALANNTTGNGNTAMGAQALNATSTGGENTAIGSNALANNNGGNNTATGYQALVFNTTGNNNTATGFNALLDNTSGGYNSATGFAALYYNTTGSSNIGVGVGAGGSTVAANANTIGSDDTFIGAYSGPGVASSANLQNASAIGAYAAVSESNALVLGSINGVNGATSSVNVGIGKANPSQALDVVGNISASGTVTATSFSGSGAGLTGIAFSGAPDFTAAPTGTGVSQGSVYINPPTATAGQTLLGLAVGGTQKFLVDTSGDVTLGGNLNLPATTSSTAGVLNLGGARFLYAVGTNNTFLGNGAGNFTLSGSSNTATGNAALASLTFGTYNTAMGNQALTTNTTGSYNVGIGEQALLNNTAGGGNAALGYLSLLGNTTGGSNTGMGVGALEDNTTGTENIGIGVQAGDSNSYLNANTTGSYNTFIGSFSGPGVVSASNLQNATAIGANAVVSQSNALVLGSISGVNTATSSVSVGIGIAAPAYPLDVVGTIHSSTCFIAGSTTIGGTCSSDLRLKKEIQAFPQVLDKLVQLQPVSFHWRNELPEYRFGADQSMGLIAQDVEQVFPEMVSTDARGYKQVNYSELPYLMLQSIRELKAENDTLREEMKEVKAGKSSPDEDTAQLRREVEELRKLVAQIAAQRSEPK
jgi:hypothetical protein